MGRNFLRRTDTYLNRGIPDDFLCCESCYIIDKVCQTCGTFGIRPFNVRGMDNRVFRFKTKHRNIYFLSRSYIITLMRSDR